MHVQNCDQICVLMSLGKVFAQVNYHTFYPFQVDDNKKLGEWAGLCKIDREGKARKVVACSCVVVKVGIHKNLFKLLIN